MDGALVGNHCLGVTSDATQEVALAVRPARVIGLALLDQIVDVDRLVEDTSTVQARLLDGAIFDSASSVNITATSNQVFDVETLGIQAGLVAAGASFTDISIGSDDAGTIETLAHVGAGSQVGQTTEIGSMTISADSLIDATATTNAIAAGIAGNGQNSIYAVAAGCTADI